MPNVPKGGVILKKKTIFRIITTILIVLFMILTFWLRIDLFYVRIVLLVLYEIYFDKIVNKLGFLKITIILLIPFLLVIGFIIIGCVYSSMIPKDSIIVGFEGMEWNGKTYSYIDGKYTLGREIARSKDDEYGWYIREIKEDPSHNFVVACSFLDHRFFVADDYNIPTSGEITTVSWGFRNYITDREFLNAISEIASQKITTFDYETEAIFVLTDNQRMKEIYFAYENCPVPTNYK